MDASPSDASDTPDAELVVLARHGDKNAFGQLADRYMPMARRLAQRMVARDGRADDVVQEALLQAYLSLRHLKDASRFRSWFYGIVLNVCRGELRTLGKSVPSFADLADGASVEAIPVDGESGPHALVEQREVTASVLRAVEALPLKDRQATLLFYFESFSVREVAEALGTTDGAVRVHLHTARTALRERLTPTQDDLTTLEREHKSKRVNRRRKHMAQVSIADVFEIYASKDYVIVLLDQASRRALSIWVGEPEGSAIVRTLRNVSTPRPLTAEFTANLLKAGGTAVEEVRVAALKGETFYATVKLRNGDAASEVDARPSDALALAVLMGAPIFVDDAILEGQGTALSEAQAAALGRSLDALSAKLSSEILATMQPTMQSESDWRNAESLFIRQEAFETGVVGVNPGGIIVNVGKLKGFVPKSQLSAVHQRMFEESASIDGQSDFTWFGTSVVLRITEIDRERNRIILSESVASANPADSA